MALTWTTKSRIIKNSSIQEMRSILNNLGKDCSSANSGYVSNVQSVNLRTHYTGYNTSCHGLYSSCSWDYSSNWSGDDSGHDSGYYGSNWNNYDKSSSGAGSDPDTDYYSSCSEHGVDYHN